MIRPQNSLSARLAASVIAMTITCGFLQQASAADPLAFGVYDPGAVFQNHRGIAIEHVYLPWEALHLTSLNEADDYARQRDRSLLVTIEPWTWDHRVRRTPQELRSGIASGRYDRNMRDICRVLSGLNSDVTVRFAHEMDDDSGQFIWAGWEPQGYIGAYRRMIGVCRSQAPRVRFMWSPLGFDTLQAYYPGDEYVDLIGLSVFGLQAYDRFRFGRDRGFAEILRPAYDLADDFDKPIVVAELGYLGDDAYIAAWDAAVQSAGTEFADLIAIVYFQAREVYPWPDGFGLPDWRRRGNRINEIVTGRIQ